MAVGSPLPCQVVDKFVDRVAEAEATLPGGGAEELKQQTLRQEAFPKRDFHAAGIAADSYRPRRLHRVSSRNRLLHLDNQAL